MFVPVVDKDQHPLMPTTPARARRWLKSGKATAFWKGGFFCVRLNVEPAAREYQPVACGIDPGSKKEALVVASAAHTYTNIQADAVTWVKEAEAQSTSMRRTRRSRKTPCRKPRQNRRQSKQKLPPSTRARWHWKLRLARFLCQLFPIRAFVVEDIRASTRPGKQGKWNRSFSPLEVGKNWFYHALHTLAPVIIKQGWETKAMRDQLGLKKTGKKTAEVWEAHAVDAWCLASSAIGGKCVPDNRRLVCISPLRLHRRQLHRLEPERGGKRKPYGGTISAGLKRGTLVKHPKLGKAYVGGTMEGRISLHDPQTGKRLTQKAQVTDCRPLKLLRWRTRILPPASIPKRENPREHMDRFELALSTLTEATATASHIENDSQGIDELKRDVLKAAQAGETARLATEKALGRPVVSSTNFLEASRRKGRKQLPPPEQSSLFEPGEPDQ